MSATATFYVGLIDLWLTKLELINSTYTNASRVSKYLFVSNLDPSVYALVLFRSAIGV